MTIAKQLNCVPHAAARLLKTKKSEQGHNKIYTLTGPVGSYDANQRLRGVYQVMDRVPEVEHIEISGDFSKAAGEAAAKRITEEYTRPTAVFCLNDEMAIGLYRYIRTHTDLIIGFDNIELAQFVQPRLVTINYSMHKWGALDSEHLLKMLSGEHVELERIYVSLIKGETVNAMK